MAAARTWKELEMAEVWSKKSPLNQEELVSLLKILPELLNKLFDRYTQFKRSSVHVDFTALRRTALLFKAKKGTVASFQQPRHLGEHIALFAPAPAQHSF